MNPLLEVINLHKQFRDTKAVDDLSFRVNRGDIYGFLGENGAGKSTTMRMMLKLIRPTAGEILFNGNSIVADGNEMLRQTGAVIERPDLYKYLSAYDNLSLFARLSGKKINRSSLNDQLAAVGLADRSGSKVKTFSQGMKQRLGIAVALVHDPQLIILDEPINGLDPQGIADMRNLILSLSRERGKTVIVSSHLLSEMELIANRMIIIHKGKKIIEGTVSELLDPANTVVEIDTTDNAASLLILQNHFSGYVPLLFSEKIRLKMNRSLIPEFVSSLDAHGISLRSLLPRHSLEDYFLSLTNNDPHAQPFAN